MTNLLEETLEALNENGKSGDDVKWVGSNKQYSTWENFKEIADIGYNSGFGSACIAENLLIVGTNWWLERGEYDGSEWWEFKSIPKKPKDKVVLRNVSGGMWDSLEKLNG